MRFLRNKKTGVVFPYNSMMKKVHADIEEISPEEAIGILEAQAHKRAQIDAVREQLSEVTSAEEHIRRLRAVMASAKEDAPEKGVEKKGRKSPAKKSPPDIQSTDE